MSAIPASNVVVLKPVPSYNGVKIRINNPVVVTPNNSEKTPLRNNYNAVDIEVNSPKVLPENYVYNYKNAENIVTSDMAGITPVKVPKMPAPSAAYQTTNFISNKTLINAEFSTKNEPVKTENQQVATKVPEPNITTVESGKKSEISPSFNGLDNVEIIKQSDIKPEIDINDVISKLSDKNFDVQAIQLEKIARTAIKNPVQAVPYIVTDIYSSLLDIMKLDTTAYEKPTEKQIEIRKKIILNQIYLEQAFKEGLDSSMLELPYKLSKEDIMEASKLSPFEQAERNREYAILASALLTKIYVDENEKELGKIIPLTDLPCVSEYVEILRHNKNADAKIAAINALIYIYRPEYKGELKAIFELTEGDSNPIVAEKASEARKYFS